MVNLMPVLSDLPEEKIQELQLITGHIIVTGKAEIIILFGSYARGDYRMPNGEGKKSDFNILVITSGTQNKKDLRRELFGKFNEIPTPAKIIVEDCTRINEDLKDSKYFFTDILHEGRVLYNSGSVALEKARELSKEKRRQIAEEDFGNLFRQAVQLTQTAEFQKEAGMNLLAAFSIQQAVEMCYSAVEMVFNKCNPDVHDLFELRRRIVSFDPRLDKPFPLTTEDQKEDFAYLNSAYGVARYLNEDDFPVTTGQLSYWSAEAEKLLELTEEICEAWIADME